MPTLEQQRNALTIIELLAVLTIVGVLALALLPRAVRPVDEGRR